MDGITPYTPNEQPREIRDILPHPDTSYNLNNFLINFNSQLDSNNKLNKAKTDALKKIKHIYKDTFDRKNNETEYMIRHELNRFKSWRKASRIYRR